MGVLSTILTVNIYFSHFFLLFANVLGVVSTYVGHIKIARYVYLFETTKVVDSFEEAPLGVRPWQVGLVVS